MTRVLTATNELVDAAARLTSDPCTASARYEHATKKRYGSREMAWIAAAIMRLLPGGACLMHPYHCPKCRRYHLTTARFERKVWAREVIGRIHQGERP